LSEVSKQLVQVGQQVECLPTREQAAELVIQTIADFGQRCLKTGAKLNMIDWQISLANQDCWTMFTQTNKAKRVQQLERAKFKLLTCCSQIKKAGQRANSHIDLHKLALPKI
jgi:L-lactate utilization protein LutC